MTRLSLALFLASGLLSFSTTLAAPTIGSSSLLKRQAASTGSPITVVTVNTIQSSSGPVTETCTVTLTPISDNGQDAVREEKTCTQTPSSSNNNNSPPSSTDGSSNPASQQPPSATDSSVATQQTASVSNSAVQQTASSDSSDSSQQATTTIDPSTLPTDTTSVDATSVTSSTPVIPTDIQVIGASSVSTDLQPSASAVGPSVIAGPNSVSATASVGPEAAAPTDISVLGPSTMPAASVSAAAAAALASSSTAATPSTTGNSAAFAIPGKQIQVLPIGLGVFAGVSVIALIVVGLVTYERTKYRRKFRKDKLAETAAPMGYGGMAERQ